MAGIGAIEDTAGKKKKLGVLRHFVCLQINFYVGFPATAMANGRICQLYNLIGTYIHIIYPGDKRFVFW